MSSTLTVLMTFDSLYAKHAAVTLVSLKRFYGGDFTLWYVPDLLEEREKCRFKEFLRAHSIPSQEIPRHSFEKKKTTFDHISAASFERITALSLIESDFAVYLDPDVIAMQPFTFQDIPFPQDSVLSAVLNNHGLAKEEDRVELNSGVLFVNLKMWNDSSFQSRLLEAMQLELNDQQIITRALNGHWTQCDDRWNAQHSCRILKPEATINKIFEEAILFHYTGSDKPWHLFSRDVRYRRLYFELQRTAGYDTTQIGGYPVNDNAIKIRRKIFGGVL